MRFVRLDKYLLNVDQIEFVERGSDGEAIINCIGWVSYGSRMDGRKIITSVPYERVVRLLYDVVVDLREGQT